MKLRVKYILPGITAILLLCGITLAFISGGKIPLKQVPSPAEQELEMLSEPIAELNLKRYSSYPGDAPTAENSYNTPQLADALQQCAVRMFKAVLPERSTLLQLPDVVLINGHSAVVSCKAVVYGNLQQDERTLFCRVRVNYLADGSCEAEYPEFFSDK